MRVIRDQGIPLLPLPVHFRSYAYGIYTFSIMVHHWDSKPLPPPVVFDLIAVLQAILLKLHMIQGNENITVPQLVKKP